MIKTILLTGATGFVGSHILHQLVEDGFNVIILKRSSSDAWRIKDKLDQVVPYDLNIDCLEEVFTKNKIDVVINLATDYGRSEASSVSSLFSTNVVMPLELAELAAKNNVSSFWNIDSYWNTGKPLSESLNLYAYSKNILLEILKEQFVGNIQICNLKLFHVFGENDNPDKFLPFAISTLQANKTLKMTTGKQQLDFIYVREVAHQFSFILKNGGFFDKPFEEFEVGSGKAIPLNKIIERIKKELHSTADIDYGAVSERANEIMYACADIRKLTAKGYTPKYHLEDGIKALLS